jgi:putative effector of murein hydrolase
MGLADRLGGVPAMAAVFAVLTGMVGAVSAKALFGLLRVWRGGIGAAVVLHAVSNLFERWLEGR